MEMSDVLERDELEHIRKIFNKFDINGDGNITFEVCSLPFRNSPRPCAS
jgi:Ca2+-binding EF-hand superfamily protein